MAVRSTAPAGHEPELLAAARGGDQDAYRRLLEPYRAELHAHCYRMLGSVHDAEDALQEALLRAWRGLPRFEGRSSLRSWLYTIATNACLALIGRRPKRVLPIDYGPPSDPHDGPGEPLVESVWVEPYPDERLGLEDGFAGPDASYELRESVELAFVAALQHLPATQRAVLILREVLGFSAQEAAQALQTTVPAVNSALQRARKAVDERLPDQSQQATLRALGDQRLADLVESYMSAMGRGDVEAVVGMLAEDAAWSMPPLATWYRGHEALRAFLTVGPLSGRWRWRHLPARANAGDRLLHLARGRGLLPSIRARRAHALGRAHPGGHGVHRAISRARRPQRIRALARRAARCLTGGDDLRAPRPAGPGRLSRAAARAMGTWIFEPGHTAVEFRARHMMVTWVRGLFPDVHGRLELDWEQCLDATFEGTIAAAGLWTGQPERDEHLRSADFFDVANHPTIAFRGRFTERIGDIDFKGDADVTIRGATLTVPLDITYLGQWNTPFWVGDENRGDMRRIGFHATTRVNRHDFGVSWQDVLPGGGVVVSNEIILALEAEAILLDDLERTGAIEYYRDDVPRT